MTNIPSPESIQPYLRTGPVVNEQLSAPIPYGLDPEDYATKPPVIPATTPESSKDKSWVGHNWKAIVGVGAFTAGAVISAIHYGQAEQTIKKDWPEAIPAFAVTEGAAWGGAAMIFASAGNKIGNPLTLKKRLDKIREELEHNKLYRSGITINILGAIGTSTVLTAGAVSSAPESAWPLAFTVAAASLGVSGIPWVLAGRNKANSTTEKSE